MKKWLFRIGFVGAILSMSGIAFIAIANRYILNQSSARIVSYKERIKPRYVAIVLGARVYPGGVVSNSLKERLMTAKWLYKNKKVKRILVTGDNRFAHYNEVKAMYLWLVKQGVPSKDIFLDHAGFRTLDSMQRAAEIFEIKDAIICTQGFHMARAVYLARQFGIDAYGMNSSGKIYYVIKRMKAREMIARTVALLDVHLLKRRAHHLGDIIPITGKANNKHIVSERSK